MKRMLMLAVITSALLLSGRAATAGGDPYCPPGGGWGVKGSYYGSNWGAWRFCKIPGYGGYGGHGGYGNGGWGGAYYGGGYPGHHPCERCW